MITGKSTNWRNVCEIQDMSRTTIGDSSPRMANSPMIASTAKAYAVHIVPTCSVSHTAIWVLNPAAAISAACTRLTLRGVCCVRGVSFFMVVYFVRVLLFVEDRNARGLVLMKQYAGCQLD